MTFYEKNCWATLDFPVIGRRPIEFALFSNMFVCEFVLIGFYTAKSVPVLVPLRFYLDYTMTENFVITAVI